MLIGEWQDAGTVEILAEPELTTITISPETATVPVGNTRQFTAATLDQYGDPIETDPVEWSVNGEGSIDQSGLYTAPSEPATDEISAMVDGVVGYATVTVSAAGTGELSPESIQAIVEAVIAALAETTLNVNVTHVLGEPAEPTDDVAKQETLLEVQGVVENLDGPGSPTGPGGIPVVLPITVNNEPVDGASVWITTDPEGTNQIAGVIYTDTFGNTKPAFTLEPGIFYVWVQKAGINFTNPHALQVLENGTYQWYTG